MVHAKLLLREMTEGDLDAIADYWLGSEPDYLVGLGVDLSKLPTREALFDMLRAQIRLPDAEKSSLALIATLNGSAIGHCNVNNIRFGEAADLHLHLWQAEHRRQGLGAQMVWAALPIFFQRLQLQSIHCAPYALNAAPNRTLEKLGFVFVKRHVTVPSALSFEQEVCQYEMTRARHATLAESLRLTKNT
jgi:RimJ/RimL family protein N-acetyltransferase